MQPQSSAPHSGSPLLSDHAAFPNIHDDRAEVHDEPDYHHWEPVYDGEDPQDYMVTEQTIVERYRSRARTSIPQRIRRSVGKFFHGVTPKSTFLTLFPSFATNFSSYTLGSLQRDVLAGLTVAVIMIPQALASAPRVGLAPEYGLYAAFFPAIIYLLMGNSIEASIGPFAVTSLMLGEQINAAYPAIEDITDPAARAAATLDAAMSLTFYSGMILFVLGVLRFGWISSLISQPATDGFIAGSMITIIISQLSSVFQIKPPSGLSPIRNVIHILEHITETNIASFVIGAVAIATLMGVDVWSKWKKISKPIPSQIIVVIIATLISYLGRFHSRFDVGIVGSIKQGFYNPGVPSIGSFTNDIGSAFVLALIIDVISVATMQQIASQKGYTIEPNQELRALGASTIVGTFFQCFIACVSLSRSAVACQMAPATRFWSLAMCIVIFVCVMVAGPLLFHLPRAILSAVVIAAFRGALMKLDHVYHLWFVSPLEAIAYLAPFIVTITTDSQWGIVTAFAASIVFLLYETSRPSARVLARLPGTQHFRSVKKFPNSRDDPNILVFRFDARLHFVNQDFFYQRITGLIDAKLSALSKASAGDPRWDGDVVARVTAAASADARVAQLASAGQPVSATGFSRAAGSLFRAATLMRLQDTQGPPSPMTHPFSVPVERTAVLRLLTAEAVAHAAETEAHGSAGAASTAGAGAASPMSLRSARSEPSSSSAASTATSGARASGAAHAAGGVTFLSRQGSSALLRLASPRPTAPPTAAAVAVARFFPPAAIAAHRAAVLWRRELPPGLELVVVLNAQGINGVDCTALTMMGRLMKRSKNKVVFLFVGCRARVMRFLLGQSPEQITAAAAAAAADTTTTPASSSSQQRRTQQQQRSMRNSATAVSPHTHSSTGAASTTAGSTGPLTAGAAATSRAIVSPASAASTDAVSVSDSGSRSLGAGHMDATAAAAGEPAPVALEDITVSTDAPPLVPLAAVPSAGGTGAGAGAGAGAGGARAASSRGRARAGVAAGTSVADDDDAAADLEAAMEDAAAAAALPIVPAPAARPRVPPTSVIPAITSLSFHNLMNAVVFGKALTALCAMRRAHDVQRNDWLAWRERLEEAVALETEAAEEEAAAVMGERVNTADYDEMQKTNGRSGAVTTVAGKRMAVNGSGGHSSDYDDDEDENETSPVASKTRKAPASATAHAGGRSRAPSHSYVAQHDQSRGDSRANSKAAGKNGQAAASRHRAGSLLPGQPRSSYVAYTDSADSIMASEPVVKLAGVRAPTAAMDDWDDETVLRFLQIWMVATEAIEVERIKKVGTIASRDDGSDDD